MTQEEKLRAMRKKFPWVRNLSGNGSVRYFRSYRGNSFMHRDNRKYCRTCREMQKYDAMGIDKED